jgi:type I restriction enzyme M protein
MIYGQEKEESTVRLCKMNLAVHGLEGEIKNGNTYYENLFKGQKIDFVMANPPFNVSGVETEKLKDDPRFSFGLPRTDNANYIWIQQFLYSLNNKGRAGFVMANSASDARGSELEIRKKLIESGVVDIMISIGPNFFYTVTLPCMLWFFNKGKSNTDYRDKVLFIDARHIYNQIDRAHRELVPAQIEFIANIVRMYRGEKIETDNGSDAMIKEHFPDEKYNDVLGLCKIASIEEIARQRYSLNPGRYVGVAEREEEDIDFEERLEELNEELKKLNVKAQQLEEQISDNVEKLIKKTNE